MHFFWRKTYSCRDFASSVIGMITKLVGDRSHIFCYRFFVKTITKISEFVFYKQ